MEMVSEMHFSTFFFHVFSMFWCRWLLGGLGRSTLSLGAVTWWVWARGRAALRFRTSSQLHAHPFGSKGDKKAGFKDTRARGTVRNHPLGI